MECNTYCPVPAHDRVQTKCYEDELQKIDGEDEVHIKRALIA